jgi:hypothetical protein
MKSLSKLVLILVMFITFSCGNSEYKTFVDAENGFQIDYPKNWDTTNIDPRMAFMARENFKDSTDMFGEGFSVSVFDNQGMSLETIVDENVKMTNLYFNNPEIKERKFTNENGVECIEVDVTYEMNNLSLNNIAVFINSEHSLYTLTMNAEKHQKVAYEATFDAISNSFDWVD